MRQAEIVQFPGSQPSVPPMSIEAEQAFLGSALVNNAVLSRCPWLTADDFAEPVHGRIYAALRADFDAGRRADALTLAPLFAADGALADLDGAKYLARMAGLADTIDAGCEYARVLHQLARRRRLIAVADQLRAKADNVGENLDPVEIAATAQAELAALAVDRSRASSRPLQEVVDQIVGEIANPRQLLSTGLPLLDESLGGGLAGPFVMGIEARPKHGKTMTMHTIAVNLALQGAVATYFALEMGAARLTQRMLGHVGGFNAGMFRHRDEQLMDRVLQARERLPERFEIEDCPGLSFDRLRALASEHVLRRGARLFMLDYWQLVRPDKPTRNRVEFLDEVAQWLAEFAKQHNAIWIVASQENREGGSRGGDGLIMACDWHARIHKNDIPTVLRNGDRVETIWLDVAYSRDGVAEPIGSSEQAAFYFDRAGPHLRQCYPVPTAGMGSAR